MMEDEGAVDFYNKPMFDTPLLKDVIGKPHVFLEDIMASIEGEAVFKSMGVQPEKVFLLYGPPGTGKTMCMEALNNQMNLEFYMRNKNAVSKGADKDPETNLRNIPLYVAPFDLGRIGTAYINRGSLKVQRFFDNAMQLAAYGVKTVVELDEADAVLTARGDGHSEDRKVLETIMKNVQKAHDTPNLYVVFMTNLPEICDDAVLRAERVDKKYKFDLPTEAEKVKAIQSVVHNINTKAGYQVVRHYHPLALAKEMKDFNYADITSVIEGTVKERAKEITKERTDKVIPAGYVGHDRLVKYLKNHIEEFKKVGKKDPMGFR